MQCQVPDRLTEPGPRDSTYDPHKLRAPLSCAFVSELETAAPPSPRNEGTYKAFPFLSDSFGHVNSSGLILLAPKSPCSFSQGTNTCLNHIRGTALHATCNNTFNYD